MITERRPGTLAIDTLLRLRERAGGEVVNRRGSAPTLSGGTSEEPWRLVLWWPYSRSTPRQFATRFEFPVTGGKFVEAWPRASGFPLLRIDRRTRSFRTGDAEFEKLWSTGSTDAAFAREVLTPEFRRALRGLRRTGGGAPLRFDLFAAHAVFQKEERLDDVGVLHLLVVRALAAARLLRSILRGDAGIEFLGGVVERETASCPVCGAGVGRQRKACGRCGTAHHPDCWTYNDGTCAIFACGGRD